MLEAARRVGAEAVAIAEAMGCHPVHDTDTRGGAKPQMAHKPSLLQDLELGRPMEIDALVGVVQELGRLTGVPTPTVDIVLSLIRLRSRSAS